MSKRAPDRDCHVLSPDSDGIATAEAFLRRGELVAIPTETVYGLAGNAMDNTAIAGIFAVKNRPRFNPLITHFADQDAAWQHVMPNQRAQRLADTFWPGPLTLVLPKRNDSTISHLTSTGLSTLAVRVPAHPAARLLLITTQIPLAAPSANPSGTLSPTRASHVIEGLGDKIAGVVDGGTCPVGIESTVVGFDGDSPVLLRHGGVSQDRIEASIGTVAVATEHSTVSSPGMLRRHYAPSTPLTLNAETAKAGELMLGFGPDMPAGAPAGSLNLSVSGDLTEAAANIFSMLRELDAMNANGIVVMPIPADGLGRAINDRLMRASSEV